MRITLSTPILNSLRIHNLYIIYPPNACKSKTSYSNKIQKNLGNSTMGTITNSYAHLDDFRCNSFLVKNIMNRSLVDDSKSGSPSFSKLVFLNLNHCMGLNVYFDLNLCLLHSFPLQSLLEPLPSPFLPHHNVLYNQKII